MKLYHGTKGMSSVEIMTTYRGMVSRKTRSGCIVKLVLGNGDFAFSYIYANFSVGDQLNVYIEKVFDKEDKYPRGVCESVIQYAQDVA